MKFTTMLFGAAALGVLTACGIQPTGVVDAAEPARGIKPGTRVYFIVGEAKSRVRPVPSVGTENPAPVQRPQLVAMQREKLRPDAPKATLQALFTGPTDAEKADGVTTRLFDGPQVLSIENTDRTSILVYLDTPPKFSELGLQQISCTVRDLFARKTSPGAVTVSGPGGDVLTLPTCPVP